MYIRLSNVLICESHYDYIKNKHGSKSRLLFTDIDSLMYKIKMIDVYEDFSKDREIFYFSNYSIKSKYYDNSNKLVAGKMEDEIGSPIIEEFVGLKVKMYSFLVDKNSEYKKAQGVNKNVFEKITHNEYKNV